MLETKRFASSVSLQLIETEIMTQIDQKLISMENIRFQFTDIYIQTSAIAIEEVWR